MSEKLKWSWQEDALYVALVSKVISSEGGYVNDPDDKGGPTKYGIAWNYNQGALQKIGITKPEQMKDLTLDEARQIYYYKYWLAAGCNLIKDKKLAYIHFDMAVNCGVGAAAHVMFKLEPNPKDYEAGGKNKELWVKLFQQYANYRRIYYTNCDTYWKYGKGWNNRLNRVIRDGLAMACVLVMMAPPAEAGILKGLFKVATTPYRAGRAVVKVTINHVLLDAYCLHYYWI